MIHRLNRTVRLFAALAAAMQFALPAVVSVADGIVARENQKTEYRPDGVNQSNQKPAHPVDCLLCWYLSVNLAQPVALVPLLPPLPVAPLVELPADRVVAAPRPGHHSRAPPTLLG